MEKKWGFGGLCVFFAALACQAEIAAPGDVTALKKAAVKMPEPPFAPAAFRRPEGYQPRLYPYALEQISTAHSAETMARAAELRQKAEEVNAKGKWKATGPSIDRHKCPAWFEDAKLGIFIDWGLWSIASWCPPKGERLYPDWYEARMYSDYTPDSTMWGYRSYHIKNWGADFQRDHFIPLFTAKAFDAEKLCRLFKDCGAKYVVPFSKHHSGFCLWNSSFTFRDVVDQGPHRDLDGELVAACRRNGLKFGFYFSTGEWEYPILGKDNRLQALRFGKIGPWRPDMEYLASGKIAVKDFVRDYSLPQAIEFIDTYDPDLIWYDYDWCGLATDLATYDMAAYFYNKNEGRKDVAVNDRYGNGAPEEIKGRFPKTHPRQWLRTVRGDFFTDELGDTTDCIDPAKGHPWEACQSISRSFGNHWQDNESNVRSEENFISNFADIVARGGNLLLLINLDGQGAIPEIQAKRLHQIGTWLAKYGEAIYATRALAPYRTDAVDYTQSKDGAFAYAIVKKPAAEITLAVVPREGSQICEVGGAVPFAWQRTADGKGVTVRLPATLAQSALPFALKMAAR